MKLILHYLTPYMGSQNMGNLVSDLAPAQDQAIMLNYIDILSMAHCKQIQWHLNETTTALIKENSKYCLQGVGHFMKLSNCWSFIKDNLFPIGYNHLSMVSLTHPTIDKKWPPFRRRYFQIHSVEWKVFVCWLKFNWSLFLRFQLTISQHRFR